MCPPIPLRTVLTSCLALLLPACASGCDVARALYVATVHGSYAPPRAERQRIREREGAFVARLADRRILVRPVAVLGHAPRLDAAGGALLARRLTEQGLGRAVAPSARDTLPFVPQPNELAIYWTRFRALSAQVAAHPPEDADHVLQLDVFGAPERGRIGAVHVMLVDRSGMMVYGRLWNSHQPLFKEMRPASLDDAVRMVVVDLERSRSGARVGSERRPVSR
ncbi:MAG TPA: hypothetical protein VEA99_04515 [Gemmatimonadaceae bacterium]|nr:hypothetical protein [Gemmatimonadaceae bacterium]